MSTPPVFNRKTPLIAKLKRRYDLSVGCEVKHTAHYDVDLVGSGMEYTPGDSLAVLPQNCPEVADALIEVLGADPETPVPNPTGDEVPLKQALVENYVITTPDKKFLKTVVEKAGDSGAELGRLLEREQKAELADYLWGREIIDVLTEHPEVKFEAAEFVGILKKLNIRLYSISSSLRAHPDEVHLTVATVEYESHGRERKGVCSTWLAHRIEEGAEIPCFISQGKGFRLPEPEEDIPIIMIGPGTGIAPFRAFIEERRETGAKGKTWLFFGEINEGTCFFYKDEFEAALADGSLDKLTTAWSRDQADKIYVQHKIVEHGAELWEWLENGAFIYVCGDANRMAPDVDKAIRQIIGEHGGKSEEEVEEYMAAFQADKRYRRDVY